MHCRYCCCKCTYVQGTEREKEIERKRERKEGRKKREREENKGIVQTHNLSSYKQTVTNKFV